jgi:hypothetical protein
MTKGRRPQADAVRRGRTPATELEAVQRETGVAKGLTVPHLVATDPHMSELWHQVVGDGRAYTDQDVPIIMAYITNLDMAEKLRQHLYGPDGLETCLGLGPESEDGFGRVQSSPYFDQYQKCVAQGLRLAQELGATPLSRSRLGVSRVTEQSMALDLGTRLRMEMAKGGK